MKRLRTVEKKPIWFLYRSGAFQSGSPYDSGITRLEGMRRCLVRGFEKYLIFYLPQAGGIDVVRVLHGARDIEHLFADEEE